LLSSERTSGKVVNLRFRSIGIFFSHAHIHHCFTYLILVLAACLGKWVWPASLQISDLLICVQIRVKDPRVTISAITQHQSTKAALTRMVELQCKSNGLTLTTMTLILLSDPIHTACLTKATGISTHLSFLPLYPAPPPTTGVCLRVILLMLDM
jgi:hypothetical protein